MQPPVDMTPMPRRSGLLAALVAALCLTAPTAALAAGPDLKTSVSASPNPVAAGQYVSLQIVTDNVGTATANDVVAKAFLPARTMYIPGDSQCAQVGNEVHCQLGDMAAGGNAVAEVVLRLTDFSQAGWIQAFVTAHTSDVDANHANDGSHTNITVYNHSHDHHNTVQKKEEPVSLPAFSGIVERKLECDPGYVMVDAAFRGDNVDQGTGTFRSISVLGTYAEGDGYRFKLVNYAGGQAQGKLFGTCLSKTAQGANADQSGPHHTHDVQLTAPITVTRNVVAGQHYDVKVSCGAGPNDFVVAAAPGYGVSGAEGHLNYSLPGYDANGRPAWDFGFNATQSGSVEFSIRCLNRWLTTEQGHSHQLWFSHVDKYFDVPSNAPAGGTYDLDCSDEAKGIVAGFGLEDPLYMVGHDPQPKRRSFKLLNDSGSDKQAHLLLLCVGDRTGTDPPPPVAPSSITYAAKATASGSKVSLRMACPARGCGGLVELRATSTGTRAVAAGAGKVIGRTSFKSAKGKVRVRVPIAKRFRGAIASGQISAVTAVVRKHDGKVAKRVKLSLK